MRCATCSFTWSALMVGTAFLVSGCRDSPASPSTERPALAQVPADGNGNKFVEFGEGDAGSFTCPNGAQLSLHYKYWAQHKTFSDAQSRQLELVVYHTTHTWSNSAGETFVDRESGPDHYYFDQNGDLIIESTGTLRYAGVIGRLVINLTTGEVLFVTGPGFPNHLALACAALT